MPRRGSVTKEETGEATATATVDSRALNLSKRVHATHMQLSSCLLLLLQICAQLGHLLGDAPP